MIGELVYDRADMVVAPISVSPQRSRVVDFTKPFKYPTLTILMKKGTVKSTLGSFLQPFETSLWLYIFGTVNVVGLLMFLLERFSPFGWYFSAEKRTEAHNSNAETALANADKTDSKPVARNPLNNCLCKFVRPKRRVGEKGDPPVTLPQAVWLAWGIVLSTGPGELLPRSFSSRVFTVMWAGFAMIIVSAYTGRCLLPIGCAIVIAS